MPKGETIMMAPISARSARSAMAAGSGIHVSRSTSTKRGVSPACIAAPADATKVQDGIRQKLPGRAPLA